MSDPHLLTPPTPNPDRPSPVRWLLLPFVPVALAFLLAVPVRLAVLWRGRPITAVVDALDPDRKGSGQTVPFHYELDGRRWTDRQFFTAGESRRLHGGDRLSGRSLILFGHSVALTAASDLSVQTGWLIGTALVVNGIVGTLAYRNFVAPWRAAAGSRRRRP